MNHTTNFTLTDCLVVIGTEKRDNQCRKPNGRLQWCFGPVKCKMKGETVVEISLTNEEKILATLTPVTSTGKPAKVDGKPTWTTTSGDSTLEVSEDGLSAWLVSSDTPGETMFVVEADANLGEGVENITEAIKLTVNGASAVSLGLKIAVAVPK